MLNTVRWQQIQHVYYAALEREPSEREAFLDQACAGDAMLRSEVDSLLSSHDQAGSFLAAPALEVAARAIAEEKAEPPAGELAGRYRIIRVLGRGGMGEVYLAEDLRLNRKVALKLLDVSLSGDSNLRTRFLREARLASALDHPNVCTIHEIGEAGGQLFIAMQYVEGKTLKQVIGGRALSLDSLLSIALQISDSLAAAHERGILHRDIKPSNIVVTSRGQVKVLDFGLAKLVGRGGDQDDELTRTGAVMGTPSYMSPEQARAERADYRSDIFSFGVVLYEMATGLLPFKGRSQAETLNAIINLPHTPAAEVSQELPEQLCAVIDRSLAKSPAGRYQSMRQVMDDLRQVVAEAGGSRRLFNTSDVPDGVVVPYVRPRRQARLGAIARWAERLPVRWPVLLAVVAAIALAALAGWLYHRGAKLTWARQQLPRIEELAGAGKYFEAYDLAVGVQKYLADDPTITRLMPTISDTLSVTTEPAGASVYVKRFSPSEPDASPSREMIGTTPIVKHQIARGDYIVYLEKDGYANAAQTVSGDLLPDGNGVVVPPPIRLEMKLVEADRVPDRMTFVPGGEYRIVAWRRPTDARVKLDGFFIDKYEVTNQEYKEFIKAGGYLKKQFWKHPFIKDGRELPWAAAMRELHDRTGLPGPRGWSSQNFPEGKAEHPVTGITWYEADAYASFRGKQLPTIFQWEKAARNGQATFAGLTMPWGLLKEATDHRANFKGGGTVPVDSLEFGISPFGCYNMAGNAAEWCFNETSEGFITSGGSWEDPSYVFGYYGTYPAFYSSNKLGFRCAVNSADAATDQGAMKIKIEEEVPAYTPASDEAVKAWMKLYEPEKSPLDAEVVEVKEADEWRREKITYNGAAGERAIAYLYLPRNVQRPLQVVHIVPPGDVFSRARALPESFELQFSSLIKSGRAVFGVVFKGFIERDLPANYKFPSATTIEYVEYLSNISTDVHRGLDYLETRDDIDRSRIAYFGPSSINFKIILPAIEPRYRSVIFMGAGVRKVNLQYKPEANPINFAPQIRAPKLMIHGRYDEASPLKTEGEPLFRLLREPKRMVRFEGGHIPGPELITSTMNDWLDETMGPVRRE